MKFINNIKAMFHRTFFGTDIPMDRWIPRMEELEPIEFPITARAQTIIKEEMAVDAGVCPECQEHLPEQVGRGRRRKYCSDECTQAAWNRKRREERAASKTDPATFSLTDKSDTETEV